MKYILILFLACTVGSSFAQGINFETSDFQSALDKAKAENKLVFMDAYTTWCGPCKWMAKNVFTDPDVGEYYNKRFINVKMDMERGEGIDLATRYKVEAYPTLLFISGDGDMVHMSRGSRPVEDFIDLGNAANDPERQYITMKKRFDGGERTSEFLKQYTDVLTSAGMKDFDDVAQLYMDTQDDWSTKENMNFIFDYGKASIGSKLFQYTVENKDAFIALVSQEKYDQKLAYAADLDRSKDGIARDDVEQLQIHYAKYYTADQARNKAMVSYMNQLMYSKNPVDQEKFKAEIQLFLASKPDVGANFYNSVAWQVYEITDDKMLLSKAAEWAQISVDEEKNSYNTDTMAAILLKLGDVEKARLFALESIELAKKEGNDYSATTALLKKMENN